MSTPTASTTTTTSEIEALAHAIAVDGPAAHERGLRRLAAALAAVVRPSPRTDVAVDVMLDRHASPVLRSRAFSLVSAALVAEPTPTATVVGDRAA